MSTGTHGLTDRIERYLDAAPRARADAEAVGPFTLFRSRLAHPFYARPSLGWASGYATAVDVKTLRARQRELGLPETIEWIAEVAPDLSTACRDAGLRVSEHPLLVHHDPLAVPVPTGSGSAGSTTPTTRSSPPPRSSPGSLSRRPEPMSARPDRPNATLWSGNAPLRRPTTFEG